MRRLTIFWACLALVLLILISFASVLGALAADPDVGWKDISSAELMEDFPRVYTARGKEIYELKFEVILHDVNDSFVMVVDSYYAEKISVLFSNGQNNDKPARVELLETYEKAGKTLRQYKAKYNNDFYYVLIRFKLSSQQMFIRENLGRNVNLTFINIPFFIMFLVSVYQVEKTSARIPELFEAGKCKQCKTERKYLNHKRICLNCLIWEGFHYIIHEEPDLPDSDFKKKERRWLKWLGKFGLIVLISVVGWLAYLVLNLLFGGF